MVLLDRDKAKEIIRAGFAWENWTDEQRAAFQFAYNSLIKEEQLQQDLIQSDIDKKYLRDENDSLYDLFDEVKNALDSIIADRPVNESPLEHIESIKCRAVSIRYKLK